MFMPGIAGFMTTQGRHRNGPQLGHLAPFNSN